MANTGTDKRVGKSINKLTARIQQNVDDLYSRTYFSNPQFGSDLNSLAKSINNNIDRISNHSMDTFGVPSVSKLYSRLGIDAENQGQLANSLTKMFEDPIAMDDLYGTFMSNHYLKELDDEIDTVCYYMPELEEALQVKKDNVLSADHFTKDFLIISNASDSSQDAAVTFNERCKALKEKYNLLKTCEDVYDATAKYGEQFVYIIPTKTAISRLLTDKPNTLNQSMERPLKESVTDAIKIGTEKYTLSMDSSALRITETSGTKLVFRSDGKTRVAAIRESSVYGRPAVTQQKMQSVLSDQEKLRINLEFSTSNIIESAVLNNIDAGGRPNSSLSESFYNEVGTRTPEAKGNLNNTSNTGVGPDGLITGNSNPEVAVNINGAIVKLLDRQQVIPVYIEDICMGYYYIEVKSQLPLDNFIGFKSSFGTSTTTVAGENRDYNVVDSGKQDDTIRYVAGQLSNFIDKKFVNNNQDISKEIYMILKYNDLFNTPGMDSIKVTFVPPEDMVHSHFRLDKKTHRGVSDLDRGLIPAKIYSSQYITNAIAILTRGQDKRVYYVKQSVDTNISRTLLSTLSQLKQGNFGLRQYKSINSVLNITGRFNDYLIPTNASGEAPIQFEVMPGQQIDIHSDLLEILKEMAIGATGVPIDIIQTRQSIDYAMQLSMSSSKFLRTVYARQGDYRNVFLTPAITKIYNYEYGTNEAIDVNLPPPNFLNITNTSQVFNNIKDLVQSSVDMDLADSTDEALKQQYTKGLTQHYIGSYIDTSMHEKILQQAKLNLSINKKSTDES